MAGSGGRKGKPPGKLNFGGGEFWKPEVAETPRYQARKLFLECIHEVEPQVLGDLKEHVFPLYLKWDGKLLPGDVRFPNVAGSVLAEALLKTPSFPEWFVSWAHCYHLDVPWVHEVSQHTLSCWKEERSKNAWHFPERPKPAQEGIDTRFTFVHKTLPLTVKTKAEAAEAMDADYTVQRDSFLKALERRYEEAGYVRTPQKNARTAKDHFLWLAEFQIKKQSYEKIKRRWEKNSTPQMVERAVKRLADFIGLPLRPRPSKDSDWIFVSFPPYWKRQADREP